VAINELNFHRGDAEVRGSPASLITTTLFQKTISNGLAYGTA
jgi:hypothetical protein